MLYRQKTRTRADYKPEFAAKRLPTHPVARYSTFRNKWKATRKAAHSPTPVNDRSNHTCCFQCLRLSGALPPNNLPNREIWERKAVSGWLNARWVWDFGFTLPAGLIEYGVGRSPDIAGFLEPKEYIFALDPDDKTLTLVDENQSAFNIEGHSKLTGEDLHESKLRVFNTGVPNYKGELAADGLNYWLVLAKNATSFTNLAPPTEVNTTTVKWGQEDGGFYKNSENKLIFRASEGIEIEL